MPSELKLSVAAQPIKIAILAMGGEGGGVLADWIVDMGEQNGYVAQATSVPGVAQRTGATIYYVEIFPKDRTGQDCGQPVLALMPLPGDVDVVLASELMEAGRAVQRGLVTPDRTILIASTHRVYSIAEKMAIGDGRVDSSELMAHALKAARNFIRFDMAQTAEQSGSVISAVLFGALCAAGVLPFSRTQFEATIQRGGVGIESSLQAFGASYAQVQAGEVAQLAHATAPMPAENNAEPVQRHPEVVALLSQVQARFPADAHHFITEGVRRLIDYQDPAYAGLYLDRLVQISTLPCDTGGVLLRETARHLALWMGYEDTIRVADLKTRKSRFDRVRSEVRVNEGQLLAINEFMHPRIEEICETLPAALGRWLAQAHPVHRLVARMTSKGRVVTTSSLGGYLLLWGLSRLRVWRRSTLRYEVETRRIEHWLASIAQAAQHNPALAVELATCQRLVKGYGDTHARGLANYQTLMAVVESQGARLAPATLRELRDAALADEDGKQLKVARQRHALI